ncbi:MAG: tyrosine-type recombinase/integrase, partial [Gammaproteobacteria bacterium]|nr:tyrosine-type recombinase/integrase [Gammaproteobacteria bacterium]
TMADVFDRYMREIAPTKSKRSYENNVKEVRYLRAAFGEMQPQMISPQAIYFYMDHRALSSKIGANREKALLSHVINYAIRWGLCSTNPCREVKRFTEKPRDRYVEEWEFQAFKAHASDLIAAFMQFALLTALRVGDILAMRLDQIHDDAVHVTESKTGRRKEIERTPALDDAIERVRQVKRPIRSLYLFSNRRGQPYTYGGFKSNWDRAMASAVEKGILNERFNIHDLRRKAGSETHLEHAQRLLGHSNAQTTVKHYRVKPERVKPLR